MKDLFDEVEENEELEKRQKEDTNQSPTHAEQQPEPLPKQPPMLALKKDSLLNTFQSVPPHYFAKFHYESEEPQLQQKKSKSQGRDTKKPDLLASHNLHMTNFHHNPES